MLPRKEVHKRIRAFALSLPGAWEDHPWDETVAKVGKKVFVFMRSDGEGGMSVKLPDPALHDHAMSLRGAEPTGYGLGRAGWVSLTFTGRLSLTLLEEFVEESYRAVAPKKLVAELDARAGRRRSKGRRQA